MDTNVIRASHECNNYLGMILEKEIINLMHLDKQKCILISGYISKKIILKAIIVTILIYCGVLVDCQPSKNISRALGISLSVHT